jgi:hypothetical protein
MADYEEHDRQYGGSGTAIAEEEQRSHNIAPGRMANAGYSGTPLVKKLGIKPGSSLVLLGAPRGFRRELVGMPRSVRVSPTLDAPAPDLIVWFVLSGRALDMRMAAVSSTMGPGLWVAWPKKASGVVTDLTEDVVRKAGLANGLVDYKVCAVNATWSGLKFARRKRQTT